MVHLATRRRRSPEIGPPSLENNSKSSAELKREEELRKMCCEVEGMKTIWGTTRKIQPFPHLPVTSPERQGRRRKRRQKRRRNYRSSSCFTDSWRGVKDETKWESFMEVEDRIWWVWKGKRRSNNGEGRSEVARFRKKEGSPKILCFKEKGRVWFAELRGVLMICSPNLP